jgi:hypothetical protein
MRNDTTTEVKRQVKKVEPQNTWEILKNEVYIRKLGERFTEITYLKNLPRLGGKGRYEAMTDTKQAANIRRAMKELRRIVVANFGQNLANEAHLTLTYSGSMTDMAKLYNDFRKWFQELRRYYKHHNLEYVVVCEPHGHGGWHMHVLIKSDKPLWYDQGGDVSFEITRKLWRRTNGTGAGAVRHEKLPADVVDYGMYFAAYFTTSIPVDVELSGDRAAIKAASKAAEKGSRLQYYPANFKFYRCSRGIIRPKPERGVFMPDDDEWRIKENAYEVQKIDLEGEIHAIQFIQQAEFRRD